uniref:hypothetical protein n=1 Tax=Nocardia suismassiliense TaxID=2077092 RepID=UPI003F49B3AA
MAETEQLEHPRTNEVFAGTGGLTRASARVPHLEKADETVAFDPGDITTMVRLALEGHRDATTK